MIIEFFINLEMDYWVVVVYLLGVHCINAGLAYQARKEVIDLESLVEANTDKPHIAETSSNISGINLWNDLAQETAISSARQLNVMTFSKLYLSQI
jgi:hypothetical protein